jgi:hypothetical protein
MWRDYEQYGNHRCRFAREVGGIILCRTMLRPLLGNQGMQGIHEIKHVLRGIFQFHDQE